MKKALFPILSLFFFAAMTLTFNACVDNDFDEPPVEGEDPAGVVANTSIAELKAGLGGSTSGQISSDAIIDAVIISSDEFGNFYKEIFVQDETGGLRLSMDFSNSNSYYRLGRRIFILAKGMSYEIEDGTLTLGVEDDEYAVGRIPRNLLDNYILRGEFNHAITPREVSVSDLGNMELVATLVKVKDVEVDGADAGKTYANENGTGAQNIILTDCTGEFILRTSDFADFANQEVPLKNGSVVGILGRFNDDIQLYINSTVDVNFTEERCGTIPLPTGNETLMDISEIRALGVGGTIPAERKIVGTVISDRTNGNTQSRNIVIQDNSGGMVVRFTADHNYNLNDQLEIAVSGLQVSQFPEGTGALQLNNVPSTLTTVAGTNELAPAVKTIDEILSDLDNLESTLVRINNPTVSGATFDFAQDISDGTGTMDLFTGSGASFNGQSVPSNIEYIVAIVSKYNSSQLLMRGIYDVVGGGSGTTGNEEQMDIADIRALGVGGQIPAERKIVATVISDRTGGNINEQNIVVQDATGGIVIRFGEAHSFNLNDEVEIIVSGMATSQFPEETGVLQINNVNLAAATPIGTGNIAPAVKTIDEILSDIDNLESTLVRIENPSIDGATLDFAQNVTDATGTIEMFTGGGATFNGMAVPADIEHITAIVSRYNDTQILMRGDYDLVGSGTVGPSECTVDEDFQSGGAYLDPISNLAGWTNQAVVGVDEWVFKDYNDNFYAEMRSYQATSGENETWMVAPAIDISTQQVMTFESATAFWTHDALTVMFSTDYSGDVTTASWTELTPTLAGSSDDNYAWVPSGNVNLPTGSTGYVAFRYIGSSNDGETGTYRIDNLKVCEQ